MRILLDQLQQKEKTRAWCVTFETFCTCKPLHCLYLRKTLNLTTVKSVTENKAIMSICTISAHPEYACMQMMHMAHTHTHTCSWSDNISEKTTVNTQAKMGEQSEHGSKNGQNVGVNCIHLDWDKEQQQNLTDFKKCKNSSPSNQMLTSGGFRSKEFVCYVCINPHTHYEFHSMVKTNYKLLDKTWITPWQNTSPVPLSN